ncbi:hypothetical protein Scep_013122 [Stephania cephalantha]|uniref:Transmembrane protein n=1 Tax=Stephania cephalantha TaxID=152367 RepID=A0AAP0JGR3_9MAGN
MANRVAALVCLLVLALDINAGILGIEAELAQNEEVRMLISYCRDPSRKAFKLGLAAIVLLGLSHVVAVLFWGFACICSREELDGASANVQLATSCLVISWCVFLVAFGLMIFETLPNGKLEDDEEDTPHTGYLLAGGILCFVHALSAVYYCVFAKAISEEVSKMNETDVGGAQIMAENPHQGDHV